MAGDMKRKRNQKEEETETEGIKTGGKEKKAKKMGETEAVGERRTQTRANLNVSTSVIVKIHKS